MDEWMEGGGGRWPLLLSEYVVAHVCLRVRVFVWRESLWVCFFSVSPEMTRVADDDEAEDDNDDKGVLWVRVQSVHDIII